MTLLNVTKPITIYKRIGCEQCQHQGYHGRVGIFEIIEMNEQLVDDIHHQREESIMSEHIRDEIPCIQEDGIANVKAGITTLTEVLRVAKN